MGKERKNLLHFMKRTSRTISVLKLYVYMTLFFNVKIKLKTDIAGFPGGTVVENPPANAGDTGSSPGLGRSHMPRSN